MKLNLDKRQIRDATSIGAVRLVHPPMSSVLKAWTSFATAHFVDSKGRSRREEALNTVNGRDSSRRLLQSEGSSVRWVQGQNRSCLFRTGAPTFLSAPGVSRRPGGQKCPRSALSRAFTLIELLVVIAILGILAAIALPNLKEFGRGDRMAAAISQLENDLNFARQRAIADHTTIYVVFIPPVIGTPINPLYLPAGLPPAINNNLSSGRQEAINQLVRGQQISYALFSFRSVGDQPGNPTERYRSDWKTLPQGIFIPDWKFRAALPQLPLSSFQPTTQVFTNDPARLISITPFRYRGPLAGGTPKDGFPYPTVSGNSVPLTFPYVAFNYQGKLVEYDGNTENDAAKDAYIPLAQGTVLVGRSGERNLGWAPADVVENPEGNAISTPNLIHINKLTGRTRLIREELQ